MATFALYNYEFEISLPDDTTPTLFGGESPVVAAKENFNRRQDVFAELLNHDQDGTTPIAYNSKNGKQDYKHKWLMKPQDGIYYFRLLHEHKIKLHDEDMNEHPAGDFLGCRVFFDNRDGIQRLAIEMNSSFGKLSTVEDILARGLNEAMGKRYFLKVRLEHLLKPSRFWEIVCDRTSYPKGFSKMNLYFPPINLERLSEHIDYIINKGRATLGSDSTVSFKAPSGTALSLDPKDEWTNNMVTSASAIGGNDAITLFPIGKKKVQVGHDNYEEINLSDDKLNQIEHGDMGLFGLDDIKAKLKTGI
ncbi:hypothetical protein [uncultured Prevotella sp.]|uniref:hypothetical protein n=1 Tax=uncultured Prevotella sp. TaxID=159272 RepID=UPI002589B269|nr:hypothetical protein [uncultured Prevotella sp.]